MLGGVPLTDLGIFLGWGQILIHLCDLWLGLSAIGYLCTGLGMRSRTLIISSIIHFDKPFTSQRANNERIKKLVDFE